VDGPAALGVVDTPTEDVADGADVAEGVAGRFVSVDVFAWHPEPINATAVIAAASAADRILISRISFLTNSGRTEPHFAQRKRLGLVLG
jgi:hypothetical protein